MSMTINELVTRFAHTFNTRDAAAMGELFVDDAEFVNLFGGRYRGRADIVAKHAMHFAKGLAGTALRFAAPDVQAITGDVSFVQAPWHRERLPDAPEGTFAPGDGLLNCVAVRRGDGWLFASAVNIQNRPIP